MKPEFPLPSDRWTVPSPERLNSPSTRPTLPPPSTWPRPNWSSAPANRGFAVSSSPIVVALCRWPVDFPWSKAYGYAAPSASPAAGLTRTFSAARRLSAPSRAADTESSLPESCRTVICGGSQKKIPNPLVCRQMFCLNIRIGRSLFLGIDHSAMEGSHAPRCLQRVLYQRLCYLG